MAEKGEAKKHLRISTSLEGAEKLLAIPRGSRQNRATAHSQMSAQPPAAQSTDRTLRFLRRVHLMLLVAMLLSLAIAEGTPHQLIDMNRAFLGGIDGVATILAGVVLYFHLKTIRPALAGLRTKPDDTYFLVRWRKGSVVSYAMALAIVFFGVRLRLLGGTRAVSLPFYCVGTLLMLFLFPRRP